MAFFTHIFTILSISVSWFNTMIDVLLNDDIDDYLDQPYAVLEVDDQVINTPVYYQKNGVNYTFVSTINTGVVRTYTLYFEAYFPSYDIRDVAAITIRVYDDIPPTITRLPVFSMEVGNDPPVLSNGLLYEDNYDEIELLVVVIDDHNVHYHVVGSYDIRYTIIDSSFNETSAISTINIVDTSAPTIAQMIPIAVERKDTSSLISYFDIHDTYDLSLIIDIDTSHVNFDVVGNYPIAVSAVDHSGNQTTLSTTVDIIDTTPPNIVLMRVPPPITVNNLEALTKLKDYIIRVDDSGDFMSLEDITVVHDINITLIGDYIIYYTAIDGYGNRTTIPLSVKVIDDVIPVITLTEDLIFPVHHMAPFYQTFFKISDNYDAITSLEIDIITNPNFQVIGQYPIEVYVTDQSDNIALYQGYVTIVDDIAPCILQLSDLVVTDFSTHVFDSYFEISDNYDETDHISMHMNDSNVFYDVIGIYEVEIIVRDLSQNETRLWTDLFVVDVKPPILTLSQTSLTLSIHSEVPKLSDFILSINDDYDLLSIDNIEIESNLDMSHVGVYAVCYNVLDQSGNATTEILHITVDDFTAPNIICSDIIIDQYTIFDVMDGISVDESMSSVKIECFPNQVNTEMPGEYVLTYLAQDSRGNYQIATRTLTVVAVTNGYQLKDFTTVIFVILSGGIIIYAIKKHG